MAEKLVSVRLEAEGGRQVRAELEVSRKPLPPGSKLRVGSRSSRPGTPLERANDCRVASGSSQPLSERSQLDEAIRVHRP